jgi:prepilin-type N-terminal cleavage/methylation domain-containing protein
MTVSTTGRAKRRMRRGFTLIELLIVIAIVGTLLALTAGAAVRYFLNSRQRATESVLQIVDNALVQRFDSFWFHVKPPVKSRHALLAGLAGGFVTNEPQPLRLRRAQLLAKLEAMRGDFPQQFADFITAPNGIATSTDISTYADNASAVAGRTRSAIELEYRRLTFEKNPTAVPNNAPRGAAGYNPQTQIAPHDHQTEAAACLYLMLKVGSGDGTVFNIEQIPPSFVRDTDNDGVPEIVDAWGTPVRFYRWPTDLYLSMIYTSNDLQGGKSNNQNALDPEKLLATAAWAGGTGRVAFESNNNAGTLGVGNLHRVLWTNPNDNTDVWGSIPNYPIVVSAGPDAAALDADQKWQAFGYKWGPNPAAIPSSPINTSWPPVDDMETRCCRVAEEIPGYPGGGSHVDNILSRTLRAGREAN